MQIIAENIGRRLKYARKSAKITIEQMANKLNIGRRSISSYEASESTIPAIIVYGYAKICGYTVESFFNENPDAPLMKTAEVELLREKIRYLEKNQYRMVEDDKKDLIKGIADALGRQNM